jgi:hypothetical protein
LDYVGGKPDEISRNYPYATINFYRRNHGYIGQVKAISHTIGWFKFVGDESVHWFESPENELMHVYLTAGKCHREQAFLAVKLDEKKNPMETIYELDAFCILSIVDRKVDGEYGIFTVFNKELFLLRVDELNGYPTLETSELWPYFALSTDPDDYKKKKK